MLLHYSQLVLATLPPKQVQQLCTLSTFLYPQNLFLPSRLHDRSYSSLKSICFPPTVTLPLSLPSYLLFNFGLVANVSFHLRRFCLSVCSLGLGAFVFVFFSFWRTWGKASFNDYDLQSSSYKTIRILECQGLRTLRISQFLWVFMWKESLSLLFPCGALQKASCCYPSSIRTWP